MASSKSAANTGIEAFTLIEKASSSAVSQLNFVIDNQTCFVLVPCTSVFTSHGRSSASPTTVRPFSTANSGTINSAREGENSAGGLIGFSIQRGQKALSLRLYGFVQENSNKMRFSVQPHDASDAPLSEEDYFQVLRQGVKPGEKASCDFEGLKLWVRGHIGDDTTATATLYLTAEQLSTPSGNLP